MNAVLEMQTLIWLMHLSFVLQGFVQLYLN